MSMQYEYSKETGYIILKGIKLTSLPDQITIGKYHLHKKGEFHVSIMASKRLAPMMMDDTAENSCEKLATSFFEFIKTHDMKAVSLTNEFRLVKRGERVTVVVMVNMPYIEEFFSYLRTKFGVDFPTQPTHITLYTLQHERGIGLLSQEELDSESSILG